MRFAVLLLGLALAACDDFAPVSESGFGAFEPALAVSEAGIAVTWYDNRHGSDEIYLRLLAKDLRPLGREIRLTENAAASYYEADVVMLDGNPGVAWYAKNAAGELTVMLGMWSMEGEARWLRELSAPERNGRVPVLEVVGNRLFIAWIEETRPASDVDPALREIPAAMIYGAWLDAMGAYLIPPFQIAAASQTTWNLNTSALPDGRVALAYDAEVATRASELYLALVDGSAASTMLLSEDDGFASKYPDIAVGSQTSALTWFDDREGNNEVYLGFLDLQAVTTDSAITLLQRNTSRITTTAGDSIGAYLAWNGATLGLAWNDNDAGQHEIYFQAFDHSGKALSASRRLTSTVAQSLIPAIEPLGEGFVLAWGEVLLSGSHDGDQGSTRSEIVARHVE